MSLRDLLNSVTRRRRATIAPGSLPVEVTMPEFKGIAEWLNTEPLTKAALSGKVVLVDFWTYSCINCIRTLPHLKRWHEAYGDKGLVIIGIHTPEFAFEKDAHNVRNAVRSAGIRYPVAIDNEYVMWNAYGNHYWPAHYFIDANGKIRYQHFGEGGYEESEAVIRALLSEAGASPDTAAADAVPLEPIRGTLSKVERVPAPDFAKIGTPETYLGFNRMEYLGSPENVRPGATQRFTAVRNPAPNIFYFEGSWGIEPDFAAPREPGAKILYRYNASKVHLVMDPAGSTKRAEVRLDGGPLADATKGDDIVIENGRSFVDVREGRMYTLVDTRGQYGGHLLEISFLDAGTKVYAFTFS